MTEQRRITDELRQHASYAATDRFRQSMLDIADRIDAAHEEAIQREHESAYDKGYDEGFASADDWLAQHEDAMAEHGWVKLPVDAEGKPWHVGDMTEHMQTVQGMCLNRHGWHFFGTVNDIDPSIHRHYRKPTVEDVLREFGKAWVEWEDGSPYDPIAKYADKLQLKEEE